MGMTFTTKDEGEAAKPTEQLEHDGGRLRGLYFPPRFYPFRRERVLPEKRSPVLFIYAAEPGELVREHSAKSPANSPFSSALQSTLSAPCKLGQLAPALYDAVVVATEGEQRPYVTDALSAAAADLLLGAVEGCLIDALVVGCNSYKRVSLTNAVTDAQVVHASLSTLPGCSRLLLNATMQQLESALEEWHCQKTAQQAKTCVSKPAGSPWLAAIFFAFLANCEPLTLLAPLLSSESVYFIFPA